MICTRCSADKDENDFPSNGNGGRRKQCRKCMQEINKAWRAVNKERVSTYNKNRPKHGLPATLDGDVGESPEASNETVDAEQEPGGAAGAELDE